MKAIVYERYGGPDVLRLEEVQKPIPTGDQVLVKVWPALTAVLHRCYTFI
jgi:NADPH:quinone reductase-like Zn-dependent oxidoreductase